MAPFLFFAHLSAAAASGLFSAVWEGTTLAVAVALGLRMLPRLGPAARSTIWLNVFGLLILLQLIPAMIPAAGRSGRASDSLVHLDLRWSIGIACAWVVLSLWRATQIVLSAVKLRRIARSAIPVIVDDVLAGLLELHPGRCVQLCTSEDVERPGVFGFLRSRILIPPALFNGLSTEELRQILLHETEHLRRRDDWSNLLQKIALVLFPLNPALLWVERRLCAERELACDDRVLRFSPQRKSYALCLTRLAEYSVLHRGISLVLGAFDRRPELVRRVHRILDRPAKSMTGKSTLAASASLVAGALLCAAGLARSPQIISFVPTASSLQAQFSAQDAARQVSRAEFGGSPQLVRAVLPNRAARSAAQISKSRFAASPGSVRHAVSVHSHRRTTPPAIETAELNADAQPMPQEFVVLTEWTSPPSSLTPIAGTLQPRVVIAVERGTRYAAVPFANGWLIVQI